MDVYPRQKQNKKYEQNDAECIGNQAFPEIHFVTQRNFGNGYVWTKKKHEKLNGTESQRTPNSKLRSSY